MITLFIFIFLFILPGLIVAISIIIFIIIIIIIIIISLNFDLLQLFFMPFLKYWSSNQGDTNTIDTNTITSNDNTVVASSLSSSCTTIANTRDDGWNVTSSYDDNDMIEKIVNTSSPSSPKKTFISNMYESMNPKSKYEKKERNNVAYVIIQFSVI